MKNYMFYLRNTQGSIERMKNFIPAPINTLLGTYPYEELLINFPEAIVFWANPRGASVGIAPV